METGKNCRDFADGGSNANALGFSFPLGWVVTDNMLYVVPTVPMRRPGVLDVGMVGPSVNLFDRWVCQEGRWSG